MIVRIPAILSGIIASLLLWHEPSQADNTSLLPLASVLPLLPLLWCAARFDLKNSALCCAIFIALSTALYGITGALALGWMMAIPALLFSLSRQEPTPDLARLHLRLCQWGWLSLLLLYGSFWSFEGELGTGVIGALKSQWMNGLNAITLPEHVTNEWSAEEIKSLTDMAITLLPGLSIAIWCFVCFFICLFMLRIASPKTHYIWTNPNKQTSWLLHIAAITALASLIGSPNAHDLATGSFIILLYGYIVFFIVPLHFRVANQPVKWLMLVTCYLSVFLLVWPAFVMACWAMGNHTASLWKPETKE